MPSVETRTTTTVFGARVLRSGRRLWIPSEGKRVRTRWAELIDCAGDGHGGHDAQCKEKENGWHTTDASLRQESTRIVPNIGLDCTVVTLIPEQDKHEEQRISENKNVDKMWGAFYRRKRKRACLQNLDIADNGVYRNLEFRRFGKQYFRKRFKKESGHLASSIKCISILNFSHCSSNLISSFLSSILCYMRTTSLSLQHLFAFLSTSPVHDVYSLHGVHFLEECTSEMKLNACIISGVWVTIPIFSVNFSAVPCCFMSLHSSLFLRSDYLPFVHWIVPMAVAEGDSEMAIDTEHLGSAVSGSDHFGQIGIPHNIDSGTWVLAQPVPRVPKVAARNFLSRNALTIQKPRNTLRFRRNGDLSSSLSVCSIPVPGICEVSGYADSDYVPFIQPKSYITVKDDEPTRALAWKTLNYDLDSDDEEWLTNFNKQSCMEDEIHDPISAERLEFMIDSFEREAFTNPNYCADEKVVCSICLDLEMKEVVEAVYSHWFKKRKQKRCSLIRTFQLYQPRIRVIPKAIVRKKRSFQRHKSQFSRGKQLVPFLQAVQDAQQQKSAILKAKEAQDAAQKHDCVAIVKRLKAQELMENADLLTFKALMALRIAEAAKTAESVAANVGETLAASF